MTSTAGRANLAELDDLVEQAPDRYLQDSWPWRLKRGETANARPLLVRPRTTDAVSKVVRWARRYGKNIMVYGAGTNVVGAIDDTADLVLSMEQMAEVTRLDETSQVITVGAGACGATVESLLEERGFTLGHYPQSLGISTVGGWVATRATGTHSAFYGGIERLLCGLTAVLPSGDVVSVGPRVRPSGGLDLLAVMCGSEGSIGIVTEVSLAIHRRLPESFLCALFADLADAIDAQRELLQTHVPVGIARVFNAAETAAILDGAGDASGCLVVVSTIGTPQLRTAQEAAIRSVLELKGGELLPSEVAERWTQRYGHVDLVARGNENEGEMFDTIEVSLPWATAAACARELEQELGAVSVPYFLHFSHAYTTGTCLYAMLYLRSDDDAGVLEDWRAAWETTLAVVRRHDGTIGHHHGIGRARRHSYRRTADGYVHRLLKEALDEQGVLHAPLVASAAVDGAEPGF